LWATAKSLTASSLSDAVAAADHLVGVIKITNDLTFKQKYSIFVLEKSNNKKVRNAKSSRYNYVSQRQTSHFERRI
jgi:hypothetical protein